MSSNHAGGPAWARARIWILSAALVFCFCPAVPALEIGGIILPDQMVLDQEELVLNGAGLRRKFFVKVYAGGLYLEEPASDAAAIVSADRPMAVRMHFIYDGVSCEKLVETWNEGFAASSDQTAPSITAEIEAFNALFNKEARRGDIYDLAYLPGQGCRVLINGVLQGVIPGLAFKKSLFGIWLGNQPADASLKKAMLGG